MIFLPYSATDLMFGVLIYACMSISVALGSLGSGYDLIFLPLYVGFFWLWLKVKKNVIFGSFLIMFASYSATHLMFGVLICLHVDFCGTGSLAMI